MDYSMPIGLGALKQSQDYLSVKTLSDYITVLVPAGIELVFLPVAGSVLWFGFSMRATLITH